MRRKVVAAGLGAVIGLIGIAPSVAGLPALDFIGRDRVYVVVPFGTSEAHSAAQLPVHPIERLNPSPIGLSAAGLEIYGGGSAAKYARSAPNAIEKEARLLMRTPAAPN